MARILIGNVKGPIGATGPDGPRGPEGPQGIQGPLCPLTNNALATVPGVAALDAVMGKTLSDKDAALQTAVTQLNSELSVKVGKVAKNINIIGDDFSHIFKSGKIVTANFDLYLKGTIQPYIETEIAYIPPEWRPKVDVLINGVSNNGYFLTLVLMTNGVVKISSKDTLTTGVIIRLSATYIVAD